MHVHLYQHVIQVHSTVCLLVLCDYHKRTVMTIIEVSYILEVKGSKLIPLRMVSSLPEVREFNYSTYIDHTTQNNAIWFMVMHTVVYTA